MKLPWWVLFLIDNLVQYGGLFILTDGKIDGVLFNQPGDGNFVMS